MRFTQKTGCFGQPSLFHGLIGSFVGHKVKLRVNKTKVNVRVNLFAVNLHIRWTKKGKFESLFFKKVSCECRSTDLQIFMRRKKIESSDSFAHSLDGFEQKKKVALKKIRRTDSRFKSFCTFLGFFLGEMIFTWIVFPQGGFSFQTSTGFQLELIKENR